MLDKYLNQNVKILLGSDSGISTGAEINMSFNGMIIINGKLSGFDNDYVEIESAKITYNNIHGIAVLGEKEPFVINESMSSILINKSKIISIMLV